MLNPYSVGKEVVTPGPKLPDVVEGAPEREGFEPNSPICSISVIYENSFR